MSSPTRAPNPQPTSLAPTSVALPVLAPTATPVSVDVELTISGMTCAEYGGEEEHVITLAVAATLSCDPWHLGATSCADTEVRRTRRRLTDAAALISFSLEEDPADNASDETAGELAERITALLSAASSSGALGDAIASELSDDYTGALATATVVAASAATRAPTEAPTEPPTQARTAAPSPASDLRQGESIPLVLIGAGAGGLIVCCCVALCCMRSRRTKRDDQKILLSSRDISMSDVFQHQGSRRGTTGSSPMRPTNRNALV